ncbi:MAG: GNAT family N-acetyltransferase [Lachnospiraceae bacterium]|nr:GNAT family N-acetyltransferase [Lachnospiraceae bacterium]
MADTPLILRTDDLFISPIPDVELERLGNKEFEAPDASGIQTEEKEEVLRKISLLSEKDPLSGDSIFFGGHMSDRSDINERKYLTSELCSAICDNMTEESSGSDPGMNGHPATDPFIWNTVWRVFLRANAKEQVGLFRFLGTQKRGRVGFELVIFPEYRHMGYARQLVAKMRAFAFDKNDVYYLYTNIPGTEEPEEYERLLRRQGYRTEQELTDPLYGQFPDPEDDGTRRISETLMIEAPVASYSAVYVMIGLCFGMIASLFSGKMLEGLAGGLILSTLIGVLFDHFELKHRKRVMSCDEVSSGKA